MYIESFQMPVLVVIDDFQSFQANLYKRVSGPLNTYASVTVAWTLYSHAIQFYHIMSVTMAAYTIPV